MTARLPLKIGSSDQKGDDVTHWQKWATVYAKSYVILMGPVDGFYGTSDGAFTFEMKRRLIAAGHALVLNNIFDAETAKIVGYKGRVEGGAVDTGKRRNGAWNYNMPGSGADRTVGPAHQVAVHADKVHGIRDQGVDFAQGGYMGFMGGDAKLSFVESNQDMGKSLYQMHDANPDLQNLLRQHRAGKPITQDLDLFYGAYSKSATGIWNWLEEAFGPGGRYHEAAGWIRFVYNFGDPSKQPAPKDGGSPGWFPPGRGIDRRDRPQWLKDKVVSITNPLDFYAVVPDNDPIRPLFFEEIITADAELPYFVHLLNIGIQSAAQWIPVFGPILKTFSPAATSMLALGANLTPMLTNQLGGLMGQAQNANHDTDVDKKLIEMFSMQGLIKTMPALIGLIQALPGLQNHGMYHVPFPELNNRSGEQVGRDLFDLFVAGKL